VGETLVCRLAAVKEKGFLRSEALEEVRRPTRAMVESLVEGLKGEEVRAGGGVPESEMRRGETCEMRHATCRVNTTSSLWTGITTAGVRV
jgi:hypothetical protein